MSIMHGYLSDNIKITKVQDHTTAGTSAINATGVDMTGYGQSSHPMMDDPCNLDPKQQPLLVPKNLSAPCTVKYPYQLVSSDTETADIDRVVDSIRALRKVDKITLIGWSGGGIRTGTYTVRHPEKVEKLVIEASSNYSRKNADQRPALPAAGSPMTIQMRDVAEKRWLGTQKIGRAHV